MEVWTGIVTENAVATWFKVDGKYFPVASDLTDREPVDPDEYRVVTEYLEDLRWHRQLMEDLEEADISVEPDSPIEVRWRDYEAQYV